MRLQPDEIQTLIPVKPSREDARKLGRKVAPEAKWGRGMVWAFKVTINVNGLGFILQKVGG